MILFAGPFRTPLGVVVVGVEVDSRRRRRRSCASKFRVGRRSVQLAGRLVPLTVAPVTILFPGKKAKPQIIDFVNQTIDLVKTEVRT